MMLEMLKSKIHKAKLTGTRIDYEGSITIDRTLMDASGILVHEKVLVANLSNGCRLWTYAIPGGEGIVELNGAAAKKASIGDRLIIMSFALFTMRQAASHEPRIIVCDDRNTPLA